jgi:hypothetical protein
MEGNGKNAANTSKHIDRVDASNRSCTESHGDGAHMVNMPILLHMQFMKYGIIL